MHVVEFEASLAKAHLRIDSRGQALDNNDNYLTHSGISGIGLGLELEPSTEIRLLAARKAMLLGPRGDKAASMSSMLMLETYLVAGSTENSL